MTHHHQPLKMFILSLATVLVVLSQGVLGQQNVTENNATDTTAPTPAPTEFLPPDNDNDNDNMPIMMSPSERLEKYVMEKVNFLVYQTNVRLYEDPGAEVIRNVEVVHWLGPPFVVRNEATGNITNLVAHCLQFHIDVDSSLAQGAEIPGRYSTQGFSATWNGNGYNYLIGDFSDVTQFQFADVPGMSSIPYTGWETNGKSGTGGLVDSGILSFAAIDTDNELVSKLAKNLGYEPTYDKFDEKYAEVHESEHAIVEEIDDTSGTFKPTDNKFIVTIGMMIAVSIVSCAI